jgi:putative peptide zinc metalloprotease protein
MGKCPAERSPQSGQAVIAGRAELAQDTRQLVSDDSRVVFHPLSMRPEGDCWVIGRVDTGDFAAMPPAAHRAIALLSAGCVVGETAAELRRETGRDMAVADFVAELDRMGLVAAIDGQGRAGPVPVRASLPWLRQHQVRWLLSPVVPWLTAAVIAAAVALVIVHPGVLPGYRDLVWSRHSGLVLLIDGTIAWVLVWLHELGHLATARAAGVPGRFGVSTRLQFLVAQTDVSGIWAAPRRVRLTVYLSGIAVDVLIASAFVLAVGLANPAGLTRKLLLVAVLETVIELPVELLIFMRTDVYYVVQDLSGCANLYADGSARVRYLARRLRNRQAPDPARALPPRERAAVRAYCWLLLCGTVGCVAAAAVITVPAAIALYGHAIGEVSGSATAARIDGAAAIAASGGYQILWLRAWWRRHGSRVRTFLAARHQRATGGR